MRLLIYYSFITVTIMSLTGFISASSISELVSAILFFPLVIYFASEILPRRRSALPLHPPTSPKSPPAHIPHKQDVSSQSPKLPQPSKSAKLQPLWQNLKPKLPKSPKQPKFSKHKLDLAEEGEYLQPELAEKLRFDADRRRFIKLIGSASVSLFLLSLFSKRAQAAFFGSVPGPGTVALKDTSGTQIDPAQHHPTAGYKINEIDDSSIPAYFGFVNKTGNWYILKESPANTYRYKNGGSDTDFATNWSNRASLSYGYFGDEF